MWPLALLPLLPFLVLAAVAQQLSNPSGTIGAAASTPAPSTVTSNNNNNNGNINNKLPTPNPDTISDSGLGDGSPIQSGDGVITDVDNPFARPRFLWPMEPGLQQQQAWWRIPVIARGSTTHPLNASWTLEGLDNVPSRLVLQVGRRSEPKQWFNITDLDPTITQITWSIPATGFPEGRDYRLRLIDPVLPSPGQLPTFRTLESGIFYVYTPMDMTVAASLPFPPASSAPASISSVPWVAIIFAFVVTAFIMTG